MPTFGDRLKGLVNSFRGGTFYYAKIYTGNLLLRVDLNIGSYEALDITLFYNYRMVKFVLTIVADKVFNNMILDNKTNSSDQIFNIYVNKDLGYVYIEYPEGLTTLHLCSIKQLVSQRNGARSGIIESSDDISKLSKIII